MERMWDPEMGAGTLGIYAITTGRIWNFALCFNLGFREDLKDFIKENVNCVKNTVKVGSCRTDTLERIIYEWVD